MTNKLKRILIKSKDYTKKQFSISKFNYRIFLKKIDQFSIKNYLKTGLILLAVSYLVILSRLVLYGIPLELIELKNIIISVQSYFLREVFFALIVFILFLYAVLKSLNKILKKEFLSLEGSFLFFFVFIIIGDMFFDLKITETQFSILLFLISVIFLIDMFMNFKKYERYIKLLLLSLTTILLYSITREGVYQLRYNPVENQYTHFSEENVFSNVVYSYILEYKKPYLAEAYIDNEKNKHVILVLGVLNGYLYYYPENVIKFIINQDEFKNIKQNKICQKNNLVYLHRIIELLKTSALITKRFERKQIKRINIKTEYVNFENVFCISK